MQQTRLFDDDPVIPGCSAIAVLRVLGGSTTLTKAQKKFNKLVEKLNGQRRELERWQAFRNTYQQKLTGEYEPLAARLREQRIAMAKLFDRAMDGKELSKHERGKVREFLRELVAELLAESADSELVHLHDKYADTSFLEGQQDRLEIMKSFAAEAFGVNTEAYEGGESTEEFEDWLDEQVQASRSEPRPPKSQHRKKSADGGTRTVREVFRKLVSELHPDRETDPVEQARKTELMQKVNQAYKAGDLLALLELQLRIEQIDSAALAGLAEERLGRYTQVLEQQSRRLRDELAECVAPFAMASGGSLSRKLTPEAVRHKLEIDIRELKGILRNVELDLIRFQDIRLLRDSLRQHPVEPFDDDEWLMPDEFRQRPRRRRC